MYMECIDALRPDIFCSLPDEVPAGVSFNRGKKAVERSIAWTKECHEMHAKGMGRRCRAHPHGRGGLLDLAVSNRQPVPSLTVLVPSNTHVDPSAAALEPSTPRSGPHPTAPSIPPSIPRAPARPPV